MIGCNESRGGGREEANEREEIRSNSNYNKADFNGATEFAGRNQGTPPLLPLMEQKGAPPHPLPRELYPSSSSGYNAARRHTVIHRRWRCKCLTNPLSRGTTGSRSFSRATSRLFISRPLLSFLFFFLFFFLCSLPSLLLPSSAAIS